MFIIYDTYSETGKIPTSVIKSIQQTVAQLQAAGCEFKNEVVYFDKDYNEYPLTNPPYEVFAEEGIVSMGLSNDGKDFCTEEDRSEFNKLFIQGLEKDYSRIRQLYHSRKETL